MSTSLRRRIERLEAKLAVSEKTSDRDDAPPFYQCVYVTPEGQVQDYFTREPLEHNPDNNDLEFNIVGSFRFLTELGEVQEV